MKYRWLYNYHTYQKFFFFTISLDQQGKYSKISLTVDQLLTKLKIKQNQKNCNNNNTNNTKNNNNNSSIPKIQIVDVDHNKSMQTAEGKFEMDYESLIEQATEAQTILTQLLEYNCKFKRAFLID